MLLEVEGKHTYRRHGLHKRHVRNFLRFNLILFLSAPETLVFILVKWDQALRRTRRSWYDFYSLVVVGSDVHVCLCVCA